MIAFTTYIRPDQACALRAHSEATRVPVAVLVRQALDLFLAVQGYPRSWRSAPYRREAAE